MDIHFVSHYQKMEDSELNIILKGTPKSEMHDPLYLMNLMFTSAKLFHPKCKMTVLTNQTTEISGLSEEVEIIRYPYDKFECRLAEQLSIYQFLKNYSGHSPIIFLDLDILVQENLESVFNEQFDLFLIRRATNYTQKHPINMGVIGVHQNRYEQAARFFNAIVTQILPFKELHQWSGSQLAIQKILFEHLHHKKSTEYISYNGICIRFVSDEYNFTPLEVNLSKFSPGKKIIHFKGTKKKQMPAYWEKYLKPDIPK